MYQRYQQGLGFRIVLLALFKDLLGLGAIFTSGMIAGHSQIAQRVLGKVLDDFSVGLFGLLPLVAGRLEIT